MYKSTVEQRMIQEVEKQIKKKQEEIRLKKRKRNISRKNKEQKNN